MRDGGPAAGIRADAGLLLGLSQLNPLLTKQYRSSSSEFDNFSEAAAAASAGRASGDASAPDAADVAAPAAGEKPDGSLPAGPLGCTLMEPESRPARGFRGAQAGTTAGARTPPSPAASTRLNRRAGRGVPAALRVARQHAAASKRAVRRLTTPMCCAVCPAAGKKPKLPKRQALVCKVRECARPRRVSALGEGGIMAR
jgi:hypothetical protein